MELVLYFILNKIWVAIMLVVSQFWGWIVGGAVGILAFLFSPILRKYTIGAIAILIVGVAVYWYGYNSNHTVQVVTHTCDEFRRWLVTGPATDKAIAIFKRHGLCL
jgi:hypothetical protein